MMAKRGGRKRKSGKREPNGRVQRDRGVDPAMIAARMPHRASAVVYAFPSGMVVSAFVPQAELRSEKAENPMGRLRLVGAISEDQYLAGRQFARIVSQYRRVLECKKQSESVAGFGQPGARSGTEIDENRAIEILADYMEAFCAIGTRASQAAVKHVVIHELELDPGLFPHLHDGLKKLVTHYRLTT